jgi:hypothetical protein
VLAVDQTGVGRPVWACSGGRPCGPGCGR